MANVTDLMGEKPPEEIQSLAELRAGIDEVDAAIIELLGRRWQYASRVGRFKVSERVPVRDEPRFAAQIARAVALGVKQGVPASIVEGLWRTMIETHVVIEHDLVAEAKAEAERASRL